MWRIINALIIILLVLFIQEAQLSQRGRSMLFVIEYFVKSLVVIRNDILEYGVCKSLLVFRCN